MGMEERVIGLGKRMIEWTRVTWAGMIYQDTRHEGIENVRIAAIEAYS